MEISVEVPQKLRAELPIIHELYSSKGIEDSVHKRKLHAHVYCSTVHNSQVIESP
jgi:hypothetical protein